MNQGAQRLREYLDKREVTQEAMAEAIHTTPATISRIVNGLNIPSIDMSVRIKTYTDGYVTPDDFVKPAVA